MIGSLDSPPIVIKGARWLWIIGAISFVILGLFGWRYIEAGLKGDSVGIGLGAFCTALGSVSGLGWAYEAFHIKTLKIDASGLEYRRGAEIQIWSWSQLKSLEVKEIGRGTTFIYYTDSIKGYSHLPSNWEISDYKLLKILTAAKAKFDHATKQG